MGSEFDPLADTAAASPDSAATPTTVRGPVKPTGTRLGRYVIEALLGQGGMGAVYAARDPELRRSVAIKVMHPHLAELRERLRSEGQAIAQLRHPNVVSIYDVGTEDDTVFIAMELVAGKTLREWLSEPRSWRDVVDTLVAAGRGLAAAHAAGFVHRDFKPDNVLVGDDGAVVVTDFGLAKPASGQLSSKNAPAFEGATQTGAFAGTPAYMSPEQFRAEKIDARSDQFSFSVTLYEGLFGARPFAGDTFAALGEAVARGELPPRPASKVPLWVYRALVRGLQVAPARRFASMEELLAELSRVRSRRPILLALAGAVVLAAGVVIALLPAKERPPLRIGGSRTLGRLAAGHVESRALLGNGRVVDVLDGKMTISNLSGSERKDVTSPDGDPFEKPVPAARDGSFMISTRHGRGCSFWLAVGGGDHFEKVADDSCENFVAISPDRLLVATADATGAHVRHRAGSEPLWSAAMRRPVESLGWSPDGKYLLVATDNDLAVVDGVSGREVVTRFKSHDAAWLDSTRLIYAARGSLFKDRVGLLEVAPTVKDHDLGSLDGPNRGVSSDGHAVLLTRVAPNNQVFEFAASDAPVDVRSLAPLDTGADMELGPAEFSSDGSVITLSLVGDKRALIRTNPPNRGVVLVSTAASAGFVGPITSNCAIYMLSLDGGICEWHSYDLTRSVDRVLWRSSCSDSAVVVCAPRRGRCIVDNHGSKMWMDPTTGALDGPAPAIPPEGALSPDGTRIARLDAGAIVVNNLVDGTERLVTPTPPLNLESGPDAWSVDWATDDTFFANVATTHELVLVQSDGTWRPLVQPSAYEFDPPRRSPDGSRYVAGSLLEDTSWIYVPVSEP